MFRLPVLTVLLACTFAYPGKKTLVPQLDGRIVGGESVNIEEYNYQVSVRWSNIHICGGSLITLGVVVTAAYCTEGLTAFRLIIRAGTSFRNSGGVTMGISSIHQHPQYNGGDFDISLLVLAYPLTPSASVGTISLPALNQAIPVGVDSTITGWGTLSEDGVDANQLQRVLVPTLSQANCRAVYGASITDRMMCAGVLEEGGRDFCHGDHGSPLVIGAQVIGLASRGHGCARPNNPGVYASVPALRDFITAIIGI